MNNNNNNNRKINYDHLISVTTFFAKLAKTIHCKNYRNKLILPSFKNIARQINRKAVPTIFYYVNTRSLKKFHTEAVKGEV